MARQITELARRYRALDTSKGDRVAAVLEGAGIVAESLDAELPLSYGSSSVGNRLENDLTLQVQRYVDRGFPSAIGMSAGQFSDAVGALVPANGFDMAYKDRFPIPTIKISGMNLDAAYGVARIRNSTDNYGDRQYFAIGDHSRVAIDIAWMNDGGVNLDKPVTEVLATLGSDERPATVADGVSLLIARPELLAFHHVYLPGSISQEEDDNRLYRTVASLVSRDHDGSQPMLSWELIGEVRQIGIREDFTAHPSVGSVTVKKTPRGPKTV